jgi:hypothetical protein
MLGYVLNSTSHTSLYHNRMGYWFVIDFDNYICVIIETLHGWKKWGFSIEYWLVSLLDNYFDQAYYQGVQIYFVCTS